MTEFSAFKLSKPLESPMKVMDETYDHIDKRTQKIYMLLINQITKILFSGSGSVIKQFSIWDFVALNVL